MKYLWILMAGLFLVSCETEPVQQCDKDAVILGYDLSLCACCGGYFIAYEGDTFRINDAPQAFLDTLAVYELDSTKNFPLDVRVSMDTSMSIPPCERIDLTCGEIQ
jgi:hypothetical protein